MFYGTSRRHLKGLSESEREQLSCLARACGKLFSKIPRHSIWLSQKSTVFKNLEHFFDMSHTSISFASSMSSIVRNEYCASMLYHLPKNISIP